MWRVVVRWSMALAVSIAAVVGAGDAAWSQTELPGIVVTTPSPIAKPKPASDAGGPSARPASAPGAQSSSAPASVPPSGPPAQSLTPPPGIMIVADDAFVPVTVVTAREIESKHGATITDTLQMKPGILGSTFAPGANRPIIRGLDNYRVRVQENGIGSHDVSNLSEDHAVPIDPYSAERIEVVRGPATLRFGPQAMGGVVSVTNNRIPEAIPRGGATGEIKGGISSVDDGSDGAIQTTAGSHGFAVHADAFKRSAFDYATPLGRQLNSFVNSDGYSVGISRIGNAGFIGVSFARFNSLYGIPGGEAALEGKSIDMTQDKVVSRGEWRVRDHGIEAIRMWLAASSYAHNELVGDGGIGSRFTNSEREGRVEVQHLPVRTALGELRGATGVQVGDRRTTGASFEGDSLLEPAHSRLYAAFWFEELQATRELRLQAAARIDQAKVSGTGLADAADPLNSTLFQGERSFVPLSGSLGALYALPHDIVARLIGQYVERSPDAGELFSKGAHEATGTFEIGNPLLRKETARTLELGFRRATGALRFDASVFHTHFDDFIFKNLTGIGCGATLASCGADTELKQLVFQQRDATYYGSEMAAQYDVAPIWHGIWGIDGQYDFVRARFRRRRQRAAHSATPAGRRHLLPGCALVCPGRRAARVRAERRRR